MLLPTPVPQATTDGTVPVTTTVPGPPRTAYFPGKYLTVLTLATGTARVVAAVPAPLQDPLQVRRLTVTGPPGSTASVWIGPATQLGGNSTVIAAGTLVDVTRRGDADLATYDPPLYVPVGMQLAVTWDTPVTFGNVALDGVGAGGVRLELVG